jgi:hypothetical protein
VVTYAEKTTVHLKNFIGTGYEVGTLIMATTLSLKSSIHKNHLCEFLLPLKG